MNRTIKEATIKAFHHPNFAALKAHALVFVMVYIFARHLNALRWRTPFRVICEAWTKKPSALRYQSAPSHSGTVHSGHTGEIDRQQRMDAALKRSQFSPNLIIKVAVRRDRIR